MNLMAEDTLLMMAMLIVIAVVGCLVGNWLSNKTTVNQNVEPSPYVELTPMSPP